MDTVIRNGLVVDGSGAPGFVADIAIDGDRIVAVGSDLPETSALEIDATGRVVAPGFIDIHTHSDFTLVADGRALSKIRQGVTTEVIGNCGGFAAPTHGDARKVAESHRERVGPEFPLDWESFADYLAVLGSREVACNVVPLVGHANIRASVLGLVARAPTDAEMRSMEQVLSESLTAGAFGMSTGLFYAPGSYSDTAEIIQLAKVIASAGGLYATHIRDEGNNTIGVEAALREALTIAEESGVTTQVSHLEAIGVPSWGMAPVLLRQIDDARSRGVDVTFDVNPYTTTGTHVDGALTPRWALEGGRAKFVQRMKDPVLRQRIRDEYNTTVYERRGGPERIFIAAYSSDPSLEGQTLAEAAQARNRDAIDLLLEIAENEDATLVSYSVSEEDAKLIMRHEVAMISSDGWAVPADGPLSEGRQHPCDFGTFPRVLQTYCRDLEYWPLETAVAMCTGRPAARLGLLDRGQIAVGSYADLVVFDFDRVTDHSSLMDPHRFPSGIEHVLVNGTAVIRDESYTGAFPGRVLRREHD